MWAVACGILLVVYFFWDSVLWKKETKRSHIQDKLQQEPLKLQGTINFLFIGAIVAAAELIDTNKNLIGTDWHPFPYLRELDNILMMARYLGTVE